MNPPRVVVYGPGYDDYRTEIDALAPYGVERIDPIPAGAVDADARLATADVVLVREAPLPAERIARLGRCRAIVRYGVGVDNIDLDAATSRRIYVANVPDYGSHEVAEHALALILAVARRLPRRDRDVRAGAWGVGTRQPMARLAGSTLGLVGFGRIAETLWRKATGLGFGATLVNDPERDTLPDGVRSVSLDVLLKEADIVSLHAPLTDATRHLIDRDALRIMRDGAILVNTARGGLIDEVALVETLEAGKLRGVGLDVFEQEPLAPGHPLRSQPDAILTDHTGWYSTSSLDELQRGAAAEVARVLQGEAPRHWVNRWTP